MALVYSIANTTNNHRYIGYTSKTIGERMSAHFCAASCKKPKMVIGCAIKKYGKDKFRVEIIKDGLSIDEAYQLEMKLIEELKPEYNVSTGGRNPFHGVKFTDERRRRQSLAQKGRKLSEEALATLRAVRGRSIVCTNDNMRYPCAGLVVSAYGIGKDAIVNSCKTGKTTKFGLRFFYADQGAPVEFDQDKALQAKKRSRQGLILGRQRSKPVICLSDGLTFKSPASASSYYGITANNIRKACNGYSNSTNGLYFAYCDKQTDHTALLAEKLTKKKMNPPAVPRPVICLNDGKRYKTGRDAAKAYGFTPSNIMHMCQQGGRTKNGLRFMYADQRFALPEKPPASEKRRKKIVNLDTGIVYESITDAAAALRCSIATISRSVNHKGGAKRIAYAA